jgi:hypothetical protein
MFGISLSPTLSRRERGKQHFSLYSLSLRERVRERER